MKPKINYRFLAKRYDLDRNLDDEALNFWIKSIHREIEVDSLSRILVVGCGTGSLALALFNVTHPSIYGLDLSHEMLVNAKNKDRMSNIVWIQGDAQELPFRNQSFTCVYMSMVLHQIEKRVKTLTESYRVIKPSGGLFVRTISHVQLKQSIINKYFPSALKLDLQRFPDIEKLRDTLTKTGFKYIKHYNLSGIPRASVSGTNISSEKLITKIENKYVSTLNLISHKEYEDGFKQLKKHLDRHDNNLVDYFTTLIIARKHTS